MNGPMGVSGRLLQRSLRRPFRGSNGILEQSFGSISKTVTATLDTGCALSQLYRRRFLGQS